MQKNCTKKKITQINKHNGGRHQMTIGRECKNRRSPYQKVETTKILTSFLRFCFRAIDVSRHQSSGSCYFQIFQ